MTSVSHYAALSVGIIYQREFSHLYGLALHTLLNISVSTPGFKQAALTSALPPRLGNRSGASAEYTPAAAAGYIMIMKSI